MNTPNDSFIQLSSHFASNLSTSSNHPTSHAIWALLTTVLFTTFPTSHPMFRHLQPSQHQTQHEHTLRKFYTFLFTRRIQCFHFLNSFNITCHMNTSDDHSIHPFSHFASNVSTSTNSTSNATRTLLTKPPFAFFFTLHGMFRLHPLIQHRMQHEKSSAQFCSPLF
jgi:hypothetical protein